MAMYSHGLRPSLLALATVCSFAAPLRADDSASAWSNGSNSAARLIAAPADEARRYRAGIEIKLAANTVTYWRSPGDFGVPPVFDFSQSRNLGSAQVSFPAPQRIDEAGSEIFGYSGDVILPIDIVPKDPGKPVNLVLKLDYAACETICLPVRAMLQLQVPPSDGERSAVLAAAEASVPRKLSAEDVAHDVRIVPAAERGQADVAPQLARRQPREGPVCRGPRSVFRRDPPGRG